MRRIAASSVRPHWQNPDPNTSPVRHSLCTRTSVTSPVGTSPRTNARWRLPSSTDSNTTTSNSPHVVCSGAVPTRRTSFSVRRR